MLCYGAVRLRTYVSQNWAAFGRDFTSHCENMPRIFFLELCYHPCLHMQYYYVCNLGNRENPSLDSALNSLRGL